MARKLVTYDRVAADDASTISAITMSTNSLLEDIKTLIHVDSSTHDKEPKQYDDTDTPLLLRHCSSATDSEAGVDCNDVITDDADTQLPQLTLCSTSSATSAETDVGCDDMECGNGSTSLLERERSPYSWSHDSCDEP